MSVCWVDAFGQHVGGDRVVESATGFQVDCLYAVDGAADRCVVDDARFNDRS
jgi:hypothetical protein